MATTPTLIKNDILEVEERADSLLLADSKNQRFWV
jgi:hypothetical protein